MKTDEAQIDRPAEPRRDAWRKVRDALFWAIGLPVLLWLAHYALFVWPNDHMSRAAIEEDGALKLPPSAANLHAFRQNGAGDLLVWVRFDMAPGDEPAFWQGTTCAKEKSFTYPDDVPAKDLAWESREGGLTPVRLHGGMHSGRFDWWCPEEARKFTRRGAAPNPEQSILIDKTDPNKYVVYVFVVR